ncbi:MAG: NAD kinase [Candidatus Planktophila sp.]|nr:NAD kinase [Candidatus Planktophila sp.]
MRNLLIVCNPTRPQAVEAAIKLAAEFSAAGFNLFTISDIEIANVTKCAVKDLPELEVGVVLGGDGTMLRAAEVTRMQQIPLLGVNLGHVGFLAEVEELGLESVVGAIGKKKYVIDSRMTLKYSVVRKGAEVANGWALNEVIVERQHATMIELFLEIDDRPISRWGCDGLICSTPTGSTAYAFSAGGPVLWPEVDALVVLPISAHALFSRPLVISTQSQIVVRIESAHGLLSADSLRNFELIQGDRVHISKDSGVVHLAHLSNTLFSDRLVAKFKLPIQGWRGE